MPATKTNYTSLVDAVRDTAALLDATMETLTPLGVTSTVMVRSNEFETSIEVNLYGVEGYLFLSHGAPPVSWYGGENNHAQTHIERHIGGARWCGYVTREQWLDRPIDHEVPSCA